MLDKKVVVKFWMSSRLGSGTGFA